MTTETNKPEIGTWLNATSESIALIASHDGDGFVLKFAGKTIAEEISTISRNIEDLGLMNAPNGLSIWEGAYCWGGEEDGSADPDGTFRPLTPDEWTRLAQTGVPWEKT